MLNQFDEQQSDSVCFVKHYLNGEKYNSSLSYFRSCCGGMESLINTYCFRTLIIHREPAEIRRRLYQTPYLIYEGFTVERTPEFEEEFQLVETTQGNCERCDQIWRCHFKIDEKVHSDEDLILSEYVDPIGVFFSFKYNTLDELINSHVRQGWKKTEVIESIHKLLKLNRSDSFADSQWENIEWLRQAVNQNQEFLDQFKAA